MLDSCGRHTHKLSLMVKQSGQPDQVAGEDAHKRFEACAGWRVMPRAQARKSEAGSDQDGR